MAAKDKMTTFTNGRWFKKVNGKQQTVTATKLQELYPELCTSLTKAGTQRAANAWLQTKLLELAKHPEEEAIALGIEQRTLIADYFKANDNEKGRQTLLGHVKEIEKAKRDLTPVSQLPFPINVLDRKTHYLGATVHYWESVLEKARTERHGKQQGNKQSLSDLITLFLDNNDGNTVTKRDLKAALTKFADWKKDNKPEIDGPSMLAFYSMLKKRVTSGEWMHRTFNANFAPVRSFYLWLHENEIADAPRAILSRSRTSPLRLLKLEDRTIDVWTHEHLTKLFATANDRILLSSLLSLNCGFYDGDIGQLTHDEIDWEAGTINRKRSKTSYTHGLDYKLWPETLQMLKQHRTTEKQRAELKKKGLPDLVLVSSRNTPIWFCSDGGSKVNLIADMRKDWVRDHRTNEPQFKNLRHTSATMLDNHETYGRFVQTFLCHKPTEVADVHYKKPSQTQFSKAVAWLREALKIAELVKTPKEPPKPKPKRKKAKAKPQT